MARFFFLVSLSEGVVARFFFLASLFEGGGRRPEGVPRPSFKLRKKPPERCSGGSLMQFCFFYFLTLWKYSLVSLKTTGLSRATAIRLGIAIRPFMVSEIAQASSSSTVPAIQAKIQKMTL